MHMQKDCIEINGETYCKETHEMPSVTIMEDEEKVVNEVMRRVAKRIMRMKKGRK